MTIRTLESENWQATSASIQLIEQVISEMTPDDDSLLSWYGRYASGQKKRLSFDLDYTHRFAPPAARILEFGSLPPILTTSLMRCGFDVCGTDLNPGRFQRAIDREGLRIVQVDFEIARLPFEDGMFDVALFNEVFEHLRINPIFTMSEVHRVLVPGGLLMLSTPNLTSWKGWYHFALKGQLAPNLYDEYLKLETLGHMGHVRLYSPGEVMAFLERTGFCTEVIIHRGEWQSRSKLRRNVGNLLLKLFPRLRTSFSVIARKVELA